MALRNLEKLAYTPDQPRENFSFPHLVPHPENSEILVTDIMLQILQHPLGVNGYDNPHFAQAEREPFTVPVVLESVEHKAHVHMTDNRFAEKHVAISQFQADAERLVGRVENFERAFIEQFTETALFEVDKPFTAELVFKLRNFLTQWIPTWYPIWDCNPITQYSHEQQVMNFAQRTLKHIDCDMLYVFEYSKAWNDKVDTEQFSEDEKEKLRLDPYFMMCRALLHDLGRWFTQDSRAHEEIPAAIAVKIGLRRDLLTLDDGNPATHPREYDVTKPVSKKMLIRIIEFFSDFNSKPHDDFVWPETASLLIALKQLDPEDPIYEQSSQLAMKLEQLRQSELRYIDLAMYYFLYSHGGYVHTSVEDSKNWYPILKELYGERNPGKLQYVVTEARMIATGRIFLEALGLAPSTMRSRVMEKWQQIGLNDEGILDAFPDLKASLEAEKTQATEIAEEVVIYSLGEVLNHGAHSNGTTNDYGLNGHSNGHTQSKVVEIPTH